MMTTEELRLAAWHLALFLGPDDDREMCDGTPVKLGHVPALLEARAFAIGRAKFLRSQNLAKIADLRSELSAAQSERDAVSRALASSLARAGALNRKLADERSVHHKTANESQVEMLHAELSVAPRLALVRAGDAMALAHTPETVAAWQVARDVAECDE